MKSQKSLKSNEPLQEGGSIEIEQISNNRWLVNNDFVIYAPNYATAYERAKDVIEREDKKAYLGLNAVQKGK